MRILRAAVRVAVPWQNGGGRTQEVATLPEGSTPDRFVWRISLAEAHEAAPFPSFPGVESKLVSIEGRSSLVVESRAGEIRSDITRYGDDAPRSLQLAKSQAITVVALRPLEVQVAAKRFELGPRDAVLVSRADGRAVELLPGPRNNDYFVIKLVAVR